jgi:hypothetical protein
MGFAAKAYQSGAAASRNVGFGIENVPLGSMNCTPVEMSAGQTFARDEFFAF